MGEKFSGHGWNIIMDVECGEYGVSILDDFYPVGHCCYCGEENYIKQCNKCGKWYEDNGENDTICTECLEEILRK